MSFRNKPKSVNGKQCISKCYKENFQFTHPLTLETIIAPNKNLCSVIPFKNDKGETIAYDECNYIEADEHDGTNFEENLNMLNPIINFFPQNFLGVYYGIESIDDFYSWLENNISLSPITQLRVINCFILVYSNNINVFEEQLAINIQEIIKKFLIKIIYKKLCDYLNVVNNKVVCVEKSKNKLSKKDHIALRTDYIINNITTKENIFVILNNYLTYIKNNEPENEYGKDYYTFLVDKFEKILIDNC